MSEDPYTPFFSKLILQGKDGLSAPTQSNRTLDRLITAFIDKDIKMCDRLLAELSTRDLNPENDEWAYNDFLVLMAFVAAWTYDLETICLRRISDYRIGLDRNDLTAKETAEILGSRESLNSLGTCVCAAIRTRPSLLDFNKRFLSIHLESSESSSPFRKFVTDHARIYLTAIAGPEIALANEKLAGFLIKAAAGYSRESKFIHALIMTASVAWMILLWGMYTLDHERWKDFLGGLSLVGATIPIPLIIALAWKRQPLLRWYRNMRFKRLGGTKYDELKEHLQHNT